MPSLKADGSTRVRNFAEATRLAEGSDDEDDVDDPYVWRSETIDGGGCDPNGLRVGSVNHGT